MSKNPHIGSSLDDFLKEEGLYEDATNHAVKRMLAWQVEKAMREQGITKAEMARRMGTSRAHLNKLLDPENDKVQLDTVQRAAMAVGHRVRLVLV
jgi:predicted XRE-type DNA-binding protein